MFKFIRSSVKIAPILKPNITSNAAMSCNFGTTLHPSSAPNFKVRDANYVSRVHESFNRQGFMDFLGAKLVKVEPGFVEIHLPYKKELR